MDRLWVALFSSEIISSHERLTIPRRIVRQGTKSNAILDLETNTLSKRYQNMQVVGSVQLLVRLIGPSLVNALGKAEMPTPYSRMEGCLLPYDPDTAPV